VFNFGHMVDATLLQHELGLTLREFQVLDYIRSHRPSPVPYEELNEAVFGQYSCSSLARNAVHRVRCKLGRNVLLTIPDIGVRYGGGAVVEAMARCLKCGRAIGRYDNEWVCMRCGASGSRRQLESHDLEVGRAAYDPTTKQGKAWTQDELDYIRDQRDTKSNAEIALDLNRTESGVRGQSTAMKLPRKAYRRNK